MFRVTDCGMSAADFWVSSPRAIVNLYRCMRKANKRPGMDGPRQKERQAQPQRLARLPR